MAGITKVRCYRDCLYREPCNKETLENNLYNTCRLKDIVISNSGKCQDYDKGFTGRHKATPDLIQTGKAS